MGFQRSAVRWMVIAEHWHLLQLALVCGWVTGFLAVTPVLGKSEVAFPLGALLVLIGAILLSGFVWIWFAAVAALRGPLLSALRNE
jgi:hypothetical protein